MADLAPVSCVALKTSHASGQAFREGSLFRGTYHRKAEAGQLVDCPSGPAFKKRTAGSCFQVWFCKSCKNGQLALEGFRWELV